jgi:curved DNA-binding protein CbpA
MMKDYYYILGLEANCSLDDIKDAYRKLSKKLHPDLNQGDQFFENRFRDIKDAFETLRDPAKRARYDASLKQTHFQQRVEAKPRGKQYNTRRADFKSFKKKGPGAGMIITLMLLAGVLAFYTVQYLFASKTPKTYQITEVAAAPVVTHKKHKRKHNRSNLVATPATKPSADTTVASAAELLHIKPAMAIPVKPQSVQLTQESDINQHKKDFLYATYVRPNVTGVINMRAYNTFESKIVETIPARSKVLVLEKGDIYYRVFFDNYIGYVPKWALQEK